MTTRLRKVVIDAPDPEPLADLYADLLDSLSLLAFDRVTDAWQRPQWPDPEYPQQLHLDLTVPNRAAVERWLPSRGAARLAEATWADPAGHPFDLFESPGSPTIGSVVFDSEDQVALAAFYSELLDWPKVGPEWKDWITIGDDTQPRLGFAKIAHHKQPRWADPGHPPQMYLELQLDDQDAAVAHAEKLGATRLPTIAPVLTDLAGHPFRICGVAE